METRIKLITKSDSYSYDRYAVQVKRFFVFWATIEKTKNLSIAQNTKAELDEAFAKGVV